jgi:hypothetical protein
MNIQEAFVKSSFITNSDLRANMIVMLVTGEMDVCDNCGFTMKPSTVCEICENEWADQMAAKEEELSFGRHDMMSPRF